MINLRSHYAFIVKNIKYKVKLYLSVFDSLQGSVKFHSQREK